MLSLIETDQPNWQNKAVKAKELPHGIGCKLNWNYKQFDTGNLFLNNKTEMQK